MYYVITATEQPVTTTAKQWRYERMKTTKIRNVAREVCCGEQKIAYNVLSNYYDSPGLYNLEFMFGVVDRLNVKVNKDVVKDLIAKNLDSYKSLKYHLLTSYEAVGEAISF